MTQNLKKTKTKKIMAITYAAPHLYSANFDLSHAPNPHFWSEIFVSAFGLSKLFSLKGQKPLDMKIS
jgi:hypothetical protein